MKKFKIYTIFILMIFVIFILNFSPANADNNGVFGEYSKGNISFISYSKFWDNDMLKKLYDELCLNFHGKEFDYLEKIIIHNNSPHGVNGLYYDDIYLNKNGKYHYGKKAYIELFNGERYNTIEKMAPILSHEYGHHYTICNITIKENKYYSEWKNSEYGKIRNLSECPIVFTGCENDYDYKWDISEIAADDYVQLLGSKNAKKSFDYKDYYEKLSSGESSHSTIFHKAFNLIPQNNSELPLATQVEGLYSYMLNISGYTAGISLPNALPNILDVSESKDIKGVFDLKWSKAVGNSPFEYTAVFYSDKNNNPYPIKTVHDGEDLTASFIPFGNNCIIKIFAKDSKNFIYSSEPFYINFPILR